MARVVGGKAHAARLKRLTGDEMVRAVGAALQSAGEMIQAEAQTSIMAGSASQGRHVASRPGQPPNNDTGGLHANIETVLVAPLKVEVSSNARYSAALEFGTSEMAARPFMRPAAAKKKAAAVDLVRAAVQHVARKA